MDDLTYLRLAHSITKSHWNHSSKKEEEEKRNFLIFYSFFFTSVEFYSTHFKVFANLKQEHKTIWEMCKTSNSSRLVHFQVKKPKHVMITRKRAMCFCTGYINTVSHCLKNNSCQEIILTELWEVTEFYY